MYKKGINNLTHQASIALLEESLLKQAKSSQETAPGLTHYLATHPDIRRKWQEDIMDLDRLEQYAI